MLLIICFFDFSFLYFYQIKIVILEYLKKTLIMENITDKIISHFGKPIVFPLVSIAGLGLFTYLAKRYLNTQKETTNQYYIKSDETFHSQPNITLTTTTGQSNIIYLFWNGDLKSTYLLIDLLLQDKVVRTIYIEQYTILKALEYDNLEKLTKQYNAIKNTSDVDTPVNKRVKQYLEDVAKIKRCQNNETLQLSVLRKMIMKQYPEFVNNFLPTQYITTINKDLQHTSDFFTILQDLQPQYYNGIEFLEQVLRFCKYFLKQYANGYPRILIGYSSDSKNIKLVKKILSKMHNNNNKSNKSNNILELPLQDTTNKDISYLATNFISNDILKNLKN